MGAGVMRICRGRVSGVFVEAEQVEEAVTLTPALGGRAFAFVVALGAPVLTAVHVGKDSLLSPLQSYLLCLDHGVYKVGQEAHPTFH